jgi:hypothetical protein
VHRDAGWLPGLQAVSDAESKMAPRSLRPDRDGNLNSGEPSLSHSAWQ